MLILSIRTDNPQAEIGLYDGTRHLRTREWQAHRQLAETLYAEIRQLLEGEGKSWADIGGIVAYEGPGSFTGLRIGLSAANALAYGLAVPITAARGADWQTAAIHALLGGRVKPFVVPMYGGEPHITLPKK